MNPPTEPTATIDDLPPEMICELFEYLHPKDLAACSMVNRRWHSIYAGFKLHRLVAIYPHHKNWNWFNSNRMIREAERCTPLMFIRVVKKPLLSNLKHLALCDFAFDLNELNRFQQLVHLEIQNDELGTKVHLNLPKLKVLAFHFFNEDCALSIDCPELRTLLYYADNEGPNLLDLKHPEAIRKLQTNWFGPRLAPFKNVECLTGQSKAISKATLQWLPKLKDLRYEVDIELVFFPEEEEEGFISGTVTVDRLKRTLNEFLSDAEKLRGRDFRFRFAGLQLTKADVGQIDFGAQVEDDFEWVRNVYVYMKNYHLIEAGALPFIKRVNYNHLLSLVTGEFPRCFSQKFSCIEYVQVDGVVKEPEHLLWFLKSLRWLRSLALEKVRLSQEFYDQLPASARSLNTLRMAKRFCESGLQLDFDFIVQFSSLSSLKIVQPLPLRSAISLVRLLGNSVNGSFIVGSKLESLWIIKDRRGWRVFKGPKFFIKSKNPDEIVNILEDLKHDNPERSPASD